MRPNLTLFCDRNVYSKDKLREMFTKVIKREFIKSEDLDNNVFGSDPNFQQIAPIKLPEDSSVSRESDVIDRPSAAEQHIHMSDLNNALRYSLFQEIGLKKKLNSTQLNALKNYLSVLEVHFPFQTDKMRTFVKYLNEWLSKKKAGVDVDTEDMMATMKIYEEYYHFPEMKPWKECAGSETKYRGYPCSVWTLFHTLTVSEYKNTLKSKKWSTLHSVLYAMRDYIKNFFGCSYCANHFQQMAADLESELTYPNSSILWLWRSHNKVNKRLKGDASEDPKHPKQPYPPRSHCPECYEGTDSSKEPKFIEKHVFEFLLKHYSSDNLIKDESELEESNLDKSLKNSNNLRAEPRKVLTPGKSDSGFNENDSSIKAKWNYSLLNNMDYSLILFLYFSSAAIILTLCVYLKIRVRRRGQKFGSLKSTLNYA